MEEKEIIIKFLEGAGFKPKGVDQFYNEEIGHIFVRTFKINIVFNQIIELGKRHHANELRQLLRISDQVETYIFNPQV